MDFSVERCPFRDLATLSVASEPAPDIFFRDFRRHFRPLFLLTGKGYRSRPLRSIKKDMKNPFPSDSRPGEPPSLGNLPFNFQNKGKISLDFQTGPGCPGEQGSIGCLGQTRENFNCIHRRLFYQPHDKKQEKNHSIAVPVWICPSSPQKPISKF